MITIVRFTLGYLAVFVGCTMPLTDGVSCCVGSFFMAQLCVARSLSEVSWWCAVAPTVASRDRLFPGCVVFVVMYATNLIWYLSCVTHVWHSVLSYWGIWRWNEMHMSTWPRVKTGEREPPIKVGIINSSVNITWNFSFNCMHLTFREHPSLNNSVGHMLMC